MKKCSMQKKIESVCKKQEDSRSALIRKYAAQYGVGTYFVSELLDMGYSEEELDDVLNEFVNSHPTATSRPTLQSMMGFGESHKKNEDAESTRKAYNNGVNLDDEGNVIPTFGDDARTLGALPYIKDMSITIKEAMENTLNDYCIYDKSNPLYDDFQEENLFLGEVDLDRNFIVVDWHSYIDPEEDLGITDKKWQAFIDWLDSKICGISCTVFIGDDVYRKQVGHRTPNKNLSFDEYEKLIDDGWYAD